MQGCNMNIELNLIQANQEAIKELGKQIKEMQQELERIKKSLLETKS
jgi:hypothetical protein